MKHKEEVPMSLSTRILKIGSKDGIFGRPLDIILKHPERKSIVKSMLHVWLAECNEILAFGPWLKEFLDASFTVDAEQLALGLDSHEGREKIAELLFNSKCISRGYARDPFVRLDRDKLEHTYENSLTIKYEYFTDDKGWKEYSDLQDLCVNIRMLDMFSKGEEK